MEGVCLVYRDGAHKDTRKHTVIQLLSCFQTQLQCPLIVVFFVMEGVHFRVFESRNDQFSSPEHHVTHPSV